jgi:hypothetical protein
MIAFSCLELLDALQRIAISTHYNLLIHLSNNVDEFLMITPLRI